MSRINGTLYSFGYGLSYTTFEHFDLNISPKIITPDVQTTVSLKVINTGKHAGDFTLMAGASSEDIHLNGTLTVEDYQTF